MNWTNLIFIYQPPTQKDEILKKVIEESYIPLFNVLKNNKNARINLAINAGLTETLNKLGYTNLINTISDLSSKGQIEFVDTPAYQAFLPMLSQGEIKRQILINKKINQMYFKNYDPLGFLPTAMAYDEKSFDVIKNLGYRYVLLDETAILGPIDYQSIYQHNGLDIFIRDRASSFYILTAQMEKKEDLISSLQSKIKGPEFLYTGEDGETFGHQRIGYVKMFEYLYDQKSINYTLFKDIILKIKKRVIINPRESTWTVPLYNEQNSFERWFGEDNKIHRLQQKLLNLALSSVYNSIYKIEDPYIVDIDYTYLQEREKTWLKARYLLDQSLYHDQFFFASIKPVWDIEMIERGAYNLSVVIDLVPDTKKIEKEKGRSYYEDILLTAVAWEREGKIKKLSSQFFTDERNKKIVDTNSDPSGYDKAIKRLETEMYNASNNREYEIADKLKTRIEEIRQEKLSLGNKN
jgi:hypothetical protein